MEQTKYNSSKMYTIYFKVNKMKVTNNIYLYDIINIYLYVYTFVLNYI